MASLAFQYRSSKPVAYLEARFSYRLEKNGKPISFYTRSEIETEKSYFARPKKGKKSQYETGTTDPVSQTKQSDLNTAMIALRKYVISRFNKTDLDSISKEWFSNVVGEYYNPKEEKPIEVIPVLLVDYIPYYLENRAEELTESSVRKYNVVKNKLIGLENSVGKRYEIKDINDKFKKEFVKYYKDEKYAQNTIQRALVFVKTICRHAHTKGIEIHREMEGLSYKKDEEVPKVWLTFEDLEKIENVQNIPEYLDNARDWLIISCYTGARVSDLLRFTSKMITQMEGGKLLEFKQQKTQAAMAIALHGKVLEILEKRNGEFPRSISDQRYNEYIKDVCKEAKLNEPTKGRLKINIAREGKKKKMRLKEGIFQKWELVSSHIGRRSMASNFYGKIPTALLMNATGHSTETMLLTYLGKGKKDLAMETFKYFK